MIGLPSIALAAVSMLFVVIWHQKRSSPWLILSGFAMALSVLTKLFTGFLAPIFVAGITASIYMDRRAEGISWRMLRPAFLWSISFAGLALLLGLVLVGPQNLSAITSPHIAAPVTEELGGYGISSHLQAAVPLLLLGVLGGIISIYRRNWFALYPIAWAGAAYGLFNFYSPVFYHHQLLISIPLTMLAAAGVGEGIPALMRLRHPNHLLRLQTWLGAGALISFALLCLHYIPRLDRDLMNRPRLTDFTLRATAGKLKVLRTMSEYTSQTNWIMTDMPMYAFRVQRPVPPNVATFSSKRLATGSLTEEDVLKAMRDYQPEQVLMARFHLPALEAYLQEHYTLILSAEFFRLFLRNDIQPVVAPISWFQNSLTEF
jgi:hypothetical protein